MTVAAGMLCRGGIVLGADTEESLGDLRLRVHKIPTHFKIPAMVTGSCENGRLMDTAVERIFDGLQDTSTDAAAVDKVLKEVMVGLYRREFRVYPEPKSTWMNLLVALKPEEEHAAMAWSIDCSAVRRMKDMEIAGGGELIRFMADKLYVTGLTVESGIVAMVQMLSYAKKLVRGAGGESYVHVLRDDGKVWVKNFRFSPEIEGLYEFFVESGRGLILATGDVTVNDANYDAVVRHFIDAMKAKRTSIVRESGIRPSTSEKLEPGP